LEAWRYPGGFRSIRHLDIEPGLGIGQRHDEVVREIHRARHRVHRKVQRSRLIWKQPAQAAALDPLDGHGIEIEAGRFATALNVQRSGEITRTREWIAQTFNSQNLVRAVGALGIRDQRIYDQIGHRVGAGRKRLVQQQPFRYCGLRLRLDLRLRLRLGLGL
jgi:hypothetical protein